MLKEIDIKEAVKTSNSNFNSPIFKICQKNKSTIVADKLCIYNASFHPDVVAINRELHCFEIKSDADIHLKGLKIK